MIALAKNPKLHTKSRYIDIRWRYQQERSEDGFVEFNYIPTEEQIADGLTKARTREKFLIISSRSRLGVNRLFSPLLAYYHSYRERFTHYRLAAISLQAPVCFVEKRSQENQSSSLVILIISDGLQYLLKRNKRNELPLIFLLFPLFPFQASYASHVPWGIYFPEWIYDWIWDHVGVCRRLLSITCAGVLESWRSSVYFR